MNGHFLIGFEKKATLRFKSLGKNIKFVRGDKTQPFLREAMLHQTALQAIKKLIPRHLHPDFNQGVKEQLSRMTIGGTIAKGRKGTRSYIAPDVIKRMQGHGSGQSLRNVVHHEAFHTKPVIGQSEILAHTWGGLNQNKVRGAKDVLGNIGHAGKGLAHAFSTRPGRSAVEVGVAGGTFYGGKELKNKINKHNNQKGKKK